WFLDKSRASYDAATTLQVRFGAPGDIPVVGDWLGTQQARIGVFRPSTGQWFLSKTNENYTPSNTIQIDNFGSAGDIPVVGKWLGGTVDSLGVFRPSAGRWFLAKVMGSYDPSTTIQIDFGAAGDVPEVGNWGGSSIIADSRSFVGVFRPATGQWFLDQVMGN